jgi:hypothetical protein
MRDVIVKPAMFIGAFFLLGLIATSSSMSSGDATSQEGCINQWLFNGVWRVQVTKVEPLMDGAQQVGWQVTEVWRNGTTQEIAPGDSLLQDQKLELQNGSILATATSTTSMSLATIASHSFQAAAQYTHVQIFRAANLDPANKPQAVDIIFDAAKLAQFRSKPQFTTHQYNFRFKLDCTATGAAAQAQGGSTQVAAIPGCLNQWVSNGVWRARATAVAPDTGDAAGAPQIGWMITEEWVSLVSRPIAPGDTNMTDQQLTLTGGNTIASSNSAGTTMNFSQLAYRTFPPGGSFTYQQRFRQAPLDPSDKPVKLLFTFNAKTQNQKPNAPHYKIPADFRIDLTCTK